MVLTPLTAPVQWIRPVDESRAKLEMVDEAVQIIQQFRRYKVRVLAVAGDCRRGKSLFMNLLFGTTRGFPLGDTIVAETAGIWIRFGKFPNSPEDEVIMVLDTEGLGDSAHGNIDYDTWIFVLSALLSSKLVFNVGSTLNMDDVRKLSFVANMADAISLRAQDDGKDDLVDQSEFLSTVMPELVYVVRDFDLTLRWGDDVITPDQYLEKTLEERRGRTEEIRRANFIKSNIKAFFPNRACFCVPHPGTTQGLENIRWDDFPNQNFKNALDKAVESILHSCALKKVSKSSSVLTVGMLFQLASSYVECLNNGRAPHVMDISAMVAENTNNNAKRLAVEAFNAPFLAVISGDDVFEAQQMRDIKKQVHESALREFHQNAFLDGNYAKHRDALEQSLQELFEDYFVRNEQRSLEWCSPVVQTAYRDLMGAKLRSGSYMYPQGTVDQYDFDVAQVHAQYSNSLRAKGPAKEVVWIKFKQSLEQERALIIESNARMEESERIRLIEEERARNLESMNAEQQARIIEIEENRRIDQENQAKALRQVEEKYEVMLGSLREEQKN
eukprot:TRINITY_DN986_c0_g1_i1.p1 TRINITY_DN986_c0_g1~~TRINITY_DN986_c0_g1_i1.p1  ORF type:complete len:557 (-),score=166.05 TRINITY_DN986_c0_g1_i1:277-1947(-)